MRGQLAETSFKIADTVHSTHVNQAFIYGLHRMLVPCSRLCELVVEE